MKLIAAVLFCAFLLGVAATHARAEEACLVRGAPAAWTVSDGDTTIYLVGTVHRLRQGEYKATFLPAAPQRVRIAVFESRPLSFLATFRAALGARTGRDLEAALSPGDWARLEALAGRVGIPRISLQRLDPFLLAGALEEKTVGSNGRSHEFGADSLLKARLARDRVETRYLETQVDIFNTIRGISYDAKVEYLIGMINLLESDRPSGLVEAWLAGNDCEMDRQANASARRAEASPLYAEIQEALVVDRNRSFAAQIETLLDTPGVMVVAVGALHFYGPANVRQLLEAAGHPVTDLP